MTKGLLKMICYGVFLSALCLSVSMNANANVLFITDENGKPLADVVVVLPEINQPASNKPMIMDQINKQFGPRVLSVTAGQMVYFPNRDNIRHHVYSFSRPKSFEIKLYSGRNTEPVKFDQAGVVVLGCNIHDNMIGYIYITAGSWSAVSDQTGKITLPDDITKESVNATLWHPQWANQNKEHNVVIALDKTGRENITPLTMPLATPSPPQPSSNSFQSLKKQG